MENRKNNKPKKKKSILLRKSSRRKVYHKKKKSLKSNNHKFLNMENPQPRKMHKLPRRSTIQATKFQKMKKKWLRGNRKEKMKRSMRQILSMKTKIKRVAIHLYSLIE